MKKIEKIYVFVADNDGKEGIVGANAPTGIIPLISSIEDDLEDLRKHAVAAANHTKKSMILVEFSARTVIEILHPEEN